MHTARYATNDNREVLCLCTGLQFMEHLSLSTELDALPFELCLNLKNYIQET
jgi:hypothetical protein